MPKFHSVFILNDVSSCMFYSGEGLEKRVAGIFDLLLESAKSKKPYTTECSCVQNHAMKEVRQACAVRFGEDWAAKKTREYQKIVQVHSSDMSNYNSQRVFHKIFGEVHDCEFEVFTRIEACIEKNKHSSYADQDCPFCNGTGKVFTSKTKSARMKSWKIGGVYGDYFSKTPLNEVDLAPGICNTCEGQRLLPVHRKTALKLLLSGSSRLTAKVNSLEAVADPVKYIRIIRKDIQFLDEDCNTIDAHTARRYYQAGRKINAKCPDCSGFDNARCMGNASTVSRFSDMIEEDKSLIPTAVVVELPDTDKKYHWYERRVCGLFKGTKTWSPDQWISGCKEIVSDQDCDSICVSVECTE